ncbi:unnamed protein product [Rotaria sp. Silwood1]|nr:unnamed protein product [Rotaria sp. Silwood1]
MNNLNENNINIFVLPSNDEIITTSNIDQNLDDENNIDSKYGYSSHYTSIFYRFAGMIRDVKIRLPYYLSDWKLAISYRIFAATIRIFFLNTILDLYLRSDHYYGVNEALLSSALGVYLIIQHNIISRYSQVPYLSFMCWVAIWTAILHWLIAIFNIVTYVRYMTNFTAEIFGFYVGIVYIQKGIEFIIDDFRESSTKGFIYLTRIIRDFLIDYAMIISVIFWSGFAFIPGHLRSTNIEHLSITTAYKPTISNRSWFINPSNLDIKYIFIALPFGLLVTALFYFDHNISRCTTIIADFLGLPYPNALVSQCAMHIDALGRWKIDESVENQVPTAVITTHKSR